MTVHIACPFSTAPASAWRASPPVLLVMALALFLAAAQPALAQNDPVVAKVIGVEIKQSDLAAAEEEIGQQLPQMPPEAKRDYLVTYVADMILVSKAAEAKKIGDTAEFKKKLALARTKLLMETLLQQEGKAAVTDAEMHKVYQDAIKQVGDEKEVRARHILVETEDEGKQLIAQIKKGGSFEKLATEKSKDQGSKGRGGDLDWATPARYVPEFGQAITKLKKGQMTDAPVKSQFGWHVIRVDDERPAKFPSFEEVKPQIEQQMRQQTVNKVFTDLRAKAKIE